MKKALTVAKWATIITATAAAAALGAVAWILRDPLTEFDDPNMRANSWRS